MKFEIDTLGIIRSPTRRNSPSCASPAWSNRPAPASSCCLLRSAGRAARHRAVLPPLAQLRVSPDHGAGLAPDGASAAPRRQRTGRGLRHPLHLPPQPLGLSVVEAARVGRERGKLWLELGAVDLLDGTPSSTSKPYVPYADSLPDARGGFAPLQAPPPPLSVSFQCTSRATARLFPLAQAPPRAAPAGERSAGPGSPPAYKRGKPDDKEYGVRLFDDERAFSDKKNRNAWSWPSNLFEQAVEAT